MSENHEELDRLSELATKKFLDRRALIFIEEAIGHYGDRFGIKETRRYLQYMLDHLEEFERE